MATSLALYRSPTLPCQHFPTEQTTSDGHVTLLWTCAVHDDDYGESSAPSTIDWLETSVVVPAHLLTFVPIALLLMLVAFVANFILFFAIWTSSDRLRWLGSHSLMLSAALCGIVLAFFIVPARLAMTLLLVGSGAAAGHPVSALAAILCRVQLVAETLFFTASVLTAFVSTFDFVALLAERKQAPVKQDQAVEVVLILASYIRVCL